MGGMSGFLMPSLIMVWQASALTPASDSNLRAHMTAFSMCWLDSPTSPRAFKQNKSLYENDPKSFDPYFKKDPHLNVIYQDDGFTMGYDSVRSTGRNLPNNPPVLQTNYFEEDYGDTFQNHEESGNLKSF